MSAQGVGACRTVLCAEIEEAAVPFGVEVLDVTVLITAVRRCVLQWTFEMLERLEGKLSRAVLRGRRGSNVPLLPGANIPGTQTSAACYVEKRRTTWLRYRS
jgi:hypothetical protein